MNAGLVLSSLCLVIGGLLLVSYVLSRRRPSLSVRIARARGELHEDHEGGLSVGLPDPVLAWTDRASSYYTELLRRSGRRETLRELWGKKLLLAFAVAFVPLAPYSAAVKHAPSLLLVIVLVVAGSFVPDLVLRADARKRREAIFLDLPEAISVMGLALRAGQSLRQSLELAARDCGGPIGQELSRALSLARRDRALDDRTALVAVARDTGEPTFLRFAELLQAKESPYVDFLADQAKQMRADQNRYLERAADRAYMAMHAPLIPLLAVLVLLVAYGFIHFLTQTV